MTISKDVLEERERCAWLCEELALRWERGAQNIREDGIYYTGFFKRRRRSEPGHENAAKSLECAAHGLRTIAGGIRDGWKIPHSPAQ